jgi:hypothetical protein
LAFPGGDVIDGLWPPGLLPEERARVGAKLLAEDSNRIPSDQEEALPDFLPMVVNALLAFAANVVIAVRHTTKIRASIAAGSTAVGPSSRRRKVISKRVRQATMMRFSGSVGWS